MSDHEGGNDDWEEGSLPGGPVLTVDDHDSIKRTIHHTRVLPKAAFTNGPRNYQPHGDGQNGHMNGLPIPRNIRNGRNPQLQDHFRGLRYDYRPQIQGSDRRMDGISAMQGTSTQPAVDNAAYARFRQQEAPNGSYTFSVTWETILRNIRGDDMPAAKVARDRLDEISITTETYIPTPLGDTNIALIFGEELQVMHARQKIEYFEKDVRGVRGVRPSAEQWIKMKALDGRQEHRNERETKLQEYLKQYRQFEDSLQFDFDDYFFWPIDLDLEQFIAEYDDSVMNDIRRQYLCRIEYDTSLGFVHSSAQSERVVHAIRTRIVNLVKEMVARLNQRVRANLFTLPSATMYRSRVGLDKDPDTGILLATLHGDALPETETKDWEQLRRRIHRRNRTQIGISVEKTLRGLQLSQMHVRLRVTFGELGFKRAKIPKEGQDSHSFDEFCEMVRNERTELQRQSLRSTGSDISGIVDQLATMPEFGEPVETYSVYFDFQAPTQAGTLRLESEFKLSVDKKELEVSQQRWLEFRPGAESDLLEINMLDFEKPNWQLYLGAVNFHENKQTRNHLAQFQHNLGFKVPPHGMKSYPKRRAIFPPGHQELRRVHELTLLTYRFKMTDGAFQLRRNDIYDEGIGQSGSTPVSSTWTAAYYYPEWDNLLGEYAYMKPGDEVSWSRSLPTFFPDDPDDEKPRGFKKFMQEIEVIQELLATAIANLSKVTTNGIH